MNERRSIAWIVPTLDAGGIGPVVFEITSAAAAMGGCDVTLIETHGSPRNDLPERGLCRVAFDMGATHAPARIVLDWLENNPQDVLFTNGVSHLEEIFPYIPPATVHVAVLHDAARRYRADIISYAQYFDGVVAVSDYVDKWMRRDLQAVGFKGIMRRIHNATAYPPARNRGPSIGPLRLLFIGNIWNKGGSRLVGIAQALQRRGVDFHLTVIGPDAVAVRSHFARAGLQQRASFDSGLPRGELWHTYAMHDLLLMLSWGEPFGMVTIEAMGMGCVPVAYDVPSGSREIIENGISGFLVPPDPGEIAAALAGVPAARLLKMSAEASRRARDHFNPERSARQYIQMADDLTRCKELICCSRATTAPPAAEPPRRAAFVRLYHALPSSLRRRIRNGLAAYPSGARWMRERF